MTTLTNGIELKGKQIVQLFAKIEDRDVDLFAINLSRALPDNDQGKIVYQKFRNGEVIDQITRWE